MYLKTIFLLGAISTTSFIYSFEVNANVQEENKMHHHSAKDLAPHLETKEREEWQKPNEVLALMGDLNDKTVMDIGAGTGYFSFRLVDAGAKVISADVDKDFIQMIEHKKASLKISDDELSTRLVPFDSPSLAENEIDLALIVDTYHHIDDRIEYFKKVKVGLKKGGSLFVLDYKKNKEIVDGPPLEMRLTKEQVQSELIEAGFSKVTTLPDTLTKQYIVQASH